MTPKQEAALRLAREALKKCDSALAEELAAWDIDPPLHHVLEASNACGPAIAAIDEALAELPAQQQELVNTLTAMQEGKDFTISKPWVGLTDEEICECERLAAIRHQRHKYSIRGQLITPADDPQWHFAGAIEAKLREKNA